jgi:hypothetical protein
MPNKEAIKLKLTIKLNVAAAKRSKASLDTKTKMRPGSMPSGWYVYGKTFISFYAHMLPPALFVRTTGSSRSSTEIHGSSTNISRIPLLQGSAQYGHPPVLSLHINNFNLQAYEKEAEELVRRCIRPPRQPFLTNYHTGT